MLVEHRTEHPLLRKVCRPAPAPACSDHQGPPDLDALSGFDPPILFDTTQNEKEVNDLLFILVEHRGIEPLTS